MTKGMKSAYKTSGEIFAQASRLHQPGLYEALTAIEPGEIVVVRGQYDHVETLLETMKVPYELIEAADIAGHNGGRVTIANCMTYNNGKHVGAVREFVQGGGRLVTTDWSLSLVQHAFPKRLTKTNQTSDDVVEVQAHTDVARRFMGLNYAQCHPKWWLEGSSHVYNIGDGVVPIITSEEMQEKYGQPYIAVGFSDGNGEVLHFISHMELQRTHLRSQADEAGLEDFLKKMNVSKTSDMEDATVAELEAAYSTLNTLAHLCVRTPILDTSMKSTMMGSAKAAVPKSKSLV